MPTICKFKGCKTNACQGFVGKSTERCSEHKEPGMVDVKNKRCIHSGCDKRPNFGVSGGIAEYCSEHKKPAMVNVVNKHCCHLDCDKQPTFGVSGGIAEYCSNHKKPAMVNVKSKRCCHSGCDKRPTFGVSGGIAEYCSSHKKPAMVNVVNKHCCHSGCDKQPTFGVSGGIAEYCSSHKKPDMVDVVHKHCCHSGCDKQPTLGLPGKPTTHCSQHRTVGMIKRPNAVCKYRKCKDFAVFGTCDTAIHCETHKADGELNLTERTCISCGLLYVLGPDNKCENCNPANFARASLSKQNAVMDFLNANDLLGISTDRIIVGSCDKERPDRVFEMLDRVVILEVDEHQHKDRNCVCEQTRMANIAQSFGGLPVQFVRYNPDTYKPASEASTERTQNQRLNMLKKVLQTATSTDAPASKSFVSVLYLYFDDWKESLASWWQELVAYEFVEIAEPKPKSTKLSKIK